MNNDPTPADQLHALWTFLSAPFPATVIILLVLIFVYVSYIERRNKP